MIQMGKSMPCLYEQMAAVPAMASAQQSGNAIIAAIIAVITTVTTT